MARAKRQHISGQVWDSTHRCHKREFLLNLNMDRQGWGGFLQLFIGNGTLLQKLPPSGTPAAIVSAVILQHADFLQH